MPPFSFNKLREELEVYSIRLFDKLDIYSKLDKPLYRNIGGFGRQPKSITMNTLYISKDDGEYSDGYKDLLKDYYLVF